MRAVPTPGLVHWGFSCRPGLLSSANLEENLALGAPARAQMASQALGPILPHLSFSNGSGPSAVTSIAVGEVAPRFRVLLALQ